ncbi:MAG: hypothetical protein BRC22_02635 [Parcubacteria group bacterium QH_9_35_7]|nr:MAG: hypothetical protein BRC22_02635 [Parcubacteria group bacterium QH_9_35_7]
MKKRTLIPLFIAFLLVFAVGVILFWKDFPLAGGEFGADKEDQNQEQRTENVFKSEVIVKEGDKQYFKKNFEDFDDIQKFQGKISEVNFATGTRSWKVSSTISEVVKRGPTFAGKYAVATWVCGQECQQSTIVDVSNGEIIVDGIRSVYDVDYRINSKLFVVNPTENVPESGLKEDVSTQYYKLKDNQLKFIGKNNISNEKENCAQIVTKAENKAIGVTLNFPTPCDVPTYGWEKVN